MPAATSPPSDDGCVIDALVTTPWFFADETVAFTESLLNSLGTRPLWAPTLWVMECAKVLQTAQRRRPNDAGPRAQIAAELAERPLDVDRLAGAHWLSPYAAAYLELALGRGLALASLNARLNAAARAIGHPVRTA